VTDPFRQEKIGVLCGVAAYGLWGLIPLYFKAVARVAPLELLAHRAMWSVVVLAIIVAWLGRWRKLWRELGSWRLRLMLATSSALIAVNWLLFIHAVVSGQVLQSSLAYFVTPLVNVLLGVAFLHERLRRGQLAAMALAAVGVTILGVFVGQWPWIASALALSFAFYGLLRKLMPVDGLVSLTVETLFMLPPAVAYLVYLAATTDGTGDRRTFGLLMLSGVVTTVPLLFFGAAARRLRLSTIGILQYLAPTLQFMLAVFVFGEPFSWVQWLSFGLIWTAIAMYTFDALRAHRQAAVIVEEFGVEPPSDDFEPGEPR
jgi:chloramphenicol-sensitive protein RarD